MNNNKRGKGEVEWEDFGRRGASVFAGVPMWRRRIFLCRSSRASASDVSAVTAFSQS